MTTIAEITSTPNAKSNGQPPPQTTALARITPGSSIQAMVQQSGNPMQFMSEMGKHLAMSGMLGLRKPEQGSTLLLICMTENRTPLSVIQEYHMMDDGKMSKKADWTLSRFREMGGTYEILNDGEDEVEATYRMTFAGQTRDVTYSMEMAKREGLVKPGSRWTKNPASMLRARVATKGCHMLAPEVTAGFDCEADLDEMEHQEVAVKVESKPRKKTDVNAMSSTTATQTVVADPIVEAQVESVPFVVGESANDFTTVLLEIELTLGEIGMTKSDLEAAMRKKNAAFTSLDSLSLPQAQEILAKLRAKKQATESAAS